MKRIILTCCALLLASGSSAQITRDWNNGKFESVNVKASPTKLNGQEVLRVERDLETFPVDPQNMLATVDEATFVKLKGTADFHNGTIEVKVLSKLLSGAPAFARGFIGIAFRINKDNSKFESIYIRPTNGRADDQLRRNHAIQYFSYPDYKFDRLRKEAPEKYESYADMGLNEWITVKIVVEGQRAALYLNNNRQPSLIVNDLKHGPDHFGAVGLWVEVGTEGYFKDLKIEPLSASRKSIDKETAVASPNEQEETYFTTSDGVQLHYRKAGTGPALVILPGYGQDASKFNNVYEGLRNHFTIYTLDYRWLGKSGTPEYGAHISRFAKDAKEMIDHAGIDEFYLFAHSMGNTVAWNYFSLFGQDKVKRYILGDEAPCLITDPGWSDKENETFTGSPEEKDLWTAWRSPRAETDPQKKLSLQEKMMARLLTHHLSNDWRDIIPTIKIPTLILMGGKSHFSSPLLWNWLTSNIESSKLEIIDEGGHGYYESHPDIFNAALMEFFLKDEK